MNATRLARHEHLDRLIHNIFDAEVHAQDCLENLRRALTEHRKATQNLKVQTQALLLTVGVSGDEAA